MSAGAASWKCERAEPPAREKRKMKKSIITIAFALASMPMFAAHQAAGQANPPAAGSTATDTKTDTKTTKKHTTKKTTKKSSKKNDTTAPVAK